MTYNEFLQNFLPEFSKIKSYSGRIEFANQHLARLGSGSGRVVYDIDGTKIFKIAKNTKGVAQNEAESNAGRYPDTHHIVAMVFDSADDDSWIIAEEAKKVNEKRIIQLTGIPNLRELYYYLRNEESSNKGRGNIFGQDSNVTEQLNDNEFVADLSNFVANYGQTTGDMGRPSSYGEVLRNGQPTIVLIDYGINDEVYNTHYVPKDKQRYRMYELFNHADGNDDELSDIKDGDIIRHGMWALIPYGVGDGIDTINEDHINFISNRDYYPSRPLTVMPYLMEIFHECVNNLEKVLNEVDDKKKFYKNLLSLQEYLINQECYDRAPLKLHEGEMINEFYDIKIAKMVADKIASKYGFNQLKYIGSGAFGIAYDIGNNRVLKITGDKSEAIENLKLIGKNLQYIAQPYEVIKISPKTTQMPETYAIILEKLQTDRPKFHRLIERMEFAFKKIMGVDYYDVILHYTDQEDFSVDEDKVNTYMKRNPEDAEFFYGVIRIAEELKKYGIESVDYINPNNLGYKPNGALAFFDVGAGSEKQTGEKPTEFEIDEDGSAKFSQVDSIGRDDFPTYDQNDTSPMTDNNIPTTNEDLEFIGGSEMTDDTHELDERILSAMKGSSTVDVKKKCRLGGLGNTSVACNQGDIKNLNIKALDESAVPYNKSYSAWVSPSNEFYVVPDYKHENFIKARYPDLKYWDSDILFDKAFEDGWVRVVSEYKPNSFITDLSLNGYDKNRVLSVLKNVFYDTLKYGHNIIRLQYENPKGFEQISTRDAEGKMKLYDLVSEGLNEEIINEGIVPHGRRFWAWVSPDNEFIEVPKMGHIDYIENIYPNSDDVYADAIKDGWVRAMYHKDSRGDNELSLNGINRERVKTVLKNIFANLIKSGNLSIYLDYEDGTNSDVIHAQNPEGKMKLYDFIRGSLNEEIDASEAYDDIDAMKTVIEGRKGAALVILNSKTEKFIEDNELNVIMVVPQHDNLYIVYKDDRDKALKIFSYLKNRGGYFNDKTPEEAWEMGKLLDYSEDSIKEYIKRIYVDKVDIYGKKLPDSDAAHLIKYVDPKYYIKESMINEAEIMSLQDLPIKNDVEQRGGKIYSVGGAVRDEFLGKESKDLDILITGIPMDELEQILSKYGRVDAVGKSFGILKFKPQGATEDIDVAIPRTERPTGEGGHKGFEVSSDYALPIEKDLERRDFTINAIAKDIDGNIIDPFGGQQDLKNKIIRIVNPAAFSDDPLRMLRAIQFASRFGFTIEPKTMQMIIKNADRIKEIPPERILTEFDKIVKKGNIFLGAKLLGATGIYESIFGTPPYGDFYNTKNQFNKVKTMGEFIYLLSKGNFDNPEEFYKNNLKGDIDTYKELRALNAAFEMDSTNPIAARSVAHNMYLYSPQSLQSQIVPENVQRAAQELLMGKYPKATTELAVNGNDLMNLGLKGKEIGDMQKSLLIKIYADKVRNNKEDLLSLASGNNTLTEDMNNVLYSAIVLDQQSHNKLVRVFRMMIPEGWEILAHHQTINMGAIKPEFQDDLGDKMNLSVIDYAIDDKVMAVGVEGYPSTNAKPHITIAVNRNAGGKPLMSNNLTDWKEINFKLELTGIVTEIKK